MLRTENHKLSIDAKSRQPIELYNLRADPNELHNLINNPDYSDVQQQLVTQILNPMLDSLDTGTW